MAKAKSSSAYKGTVTIKVKNKNKIKKTIKGKNTGTPLLFRSIAVALAGYNVGIGIPTYMAVTTTDSQDETKPNYSDCSIPVSVTGRSYGQDNSGDWFCRVTATIPKANFRNWADNSSYYALLLNGNTSGISETTNVLAYIQLVQKETGETIDLKQMSDGSSLVIEWDLYVQNYEVVKSRMGE